MDAQRLDELKRLKRDLERSERELRRIAGKQRQIRETIALLSASPHPIVAGAQRIGESQAFQGGWALSAA